MTNERTMRNVALGAVASMGAVLGQAPVGAADCNWNCGGAQCGAADCENSCNNAEDLCNGACMGFGYDASMVDTCSGGGPIEIACICYNNGSGGGGSDCCHDESCWTSCGFGYACGPTGTLYWCS